jgi:hypothetical protein
LKLVTPTHNFSRLGRVEIEETQGVQHQWRTIGQATVSRLDFRTLAREETAVSFPESRTSRYRVVIENRDSPPLLVQGVEGAGHVYELVFLAVPRLDYRLVYGHPDTKRPRYDVAAVEESLGQGYQPVQVGLGEQVELSGPVAERRWTPARLLNDSWFLFGVIALLGAGLAWVLYLASRRLADPPKREN